MPSRRPDPQTAAINKPTRSQDSQRCHATDLHCSTSTEIYLDFPEEPPPAPPVAAKHFPSPPLIP